ncbi:hypothetical protein SAFG77S_07348 [Streptomyces afghaniensis]
MKFTFVILHYLVEKDTIDCVQSILQNIDYNDIDIVIVDNCSPNDSGKSLKCRYNKYERIHVILNNENLGFAKGNNIGYKYAKYELKSDYVIMINADTIIEQVDFLKKIVEKYEEDRFDILGPDIISTKDGMHQNPQRMQGINENELKKMILALKIYRILGFFRGEWIFDLYRSMKNRDKETYIKNENWNKQYKNVQLHGSCLVFSPDYVKRYNGLYSNTFMYMEEHILYYICRQEKLISIYYPNVVIYHKEDSSSDALFSKSRDKRLFLFKNLLKSAKEFQSLRKNNNLYLNDIIDHTNCPKGVEDVC